MQVRFYARGWRQKIALWLWKRRWGNAYTFDPEQATLTFRSPPPKGILFMVTYDGESYKRA